jgi:nicotinamidase-related amidase
MHVDDHAGGPCGISVRVSKVRWPIDPLKTALLAMDLQNAFLLPESPLAATGGLAILPAFNSLIAAARVAGVRVIFTATTQDPAEPGNRMDDLFPARKAGRGLFRDTPGQQIHPDVDRRGDDLLVEKPRYSAFWHTDLDAILRRLGVDTLLIGGVWSNVCVEATARDAMFREYKVVYLSDCTATGDLPDVGYGRVAAAEVQRATLADIAFHIGEVATSIDVAARLRAATG